MTPEPIESTFFKAPVFAVHQSVLHATNNVFGMMGWVASRGPSLLPFSFWKANSAEVKLLSGAEVKLRVVSFGNLTTKEPLHHARDVLACLIVCQHVFYKL